MPTYCVHGIKINDPCIECIKVEKAKQIMGYTYIGDSVYARITKYGHVELALFDERDYESEIILEDSVLENLMIWLKANGKLK